GLAMLVPEAERLPMLNAVRIPEDADDKAARGALLGRFGLEIGGGLGPLAGQVWRVGLMGAASCPRNVFLFLGGLATVLREQGVSLDGDGLDAAASVYAEA
ncbi:MAG: alanine--glyoxylate aminotransferase family protein, partial [bacterium]